jgi:hypothetical protein
VSSIGYPRRMLRGPSALECLGMTARSAVSNEGRNAFAYPRKDRWGQRLGERCWSSIFV